MKTMKTFKDLKFKQHPAGDGLLAQMMFKNGYGVSVIRFRLPGMRINNGYASHTKDETEWELAVLKGNKKNWDICYDTPITDNVEGNLKARDVTKIMKQVQAL